jgi:hypothetical protein
LEREGTISAGMSWQRLLQRRRAANAYNSAIFEQSEKYGKWGRKDAAVARVGLSRIAVAGSLLCVVVLCAIWAVQKTSPQETDPQELDPQELENEWSYLSDGYYSVIRADGKVPLLVKRLQDEDKNNTADGVAVEGDAIESDVVEVKMLNLSQDGIFTLTDLDAPVVMNVPLSEQYGEIALGKISFGEDSVIIPANPTNLDSAGFRFTLSPDASNVLLRSNKEMILLDSEGASRTISPPTFNGKTYDDLFSEAIEFSEEIEVFWNGQATMSPDASSIAYISNKADIRRNSWDLFLLDINSEKEVLLANDETFRYTVEDWLDNDHIICSKSYDRNYSIVIVNKNGTEYDMNFAVDRPVLLGARNGLIAYSDPNCDVIYFTRFNHSSELADISRFNIHGTFRIRPGIDPFSPDGTKFAYLLVPEDSDYGRDVSVIDLNALTDTPNETVPVGTKNDSIIMEFDWLNNDSLLAAVAKMEDDHSLNRSMISSWIYHIR